MKNILYVIMICVTLSGCLSLKERYSDKKSLENINLTIMNDKSGLETVYITSSLLPSITLKGALSLDASGDTILNFNGLYTMTNGWRSYTEGNLMLYGQAKIKKYDENMTIEMISKPEVIDIQSGSMRVIDTYYRNKDGAERVKNKFDRLYETAQLLKLKDGFGQYAPSQTGLNYFFDPNRNIPEDFLTHAKRVLFPELYDIHTLYKKGLLDVHYDLSLLDSTNDLVIADDLLYRKSYTDAVIGETLKEVRNSGTMLRDFIESKKLLKALYNYDYFFDTFLPQAVLQVTTKNNDYKFNNYIIIDNLKK